MARLIKTEKEVEGRYEEVWTLVEEDALAQWPEGPRAVVGRDAPRLDGYEKARGEARYTADVKLSGTIDAVLVRSPHANARVARIDLAQALAAPGVLAAIGPGELEGIDAHAHYEGAPVAAIAALTRAQAEAALELVELEWDVQRPLLDPDEAVSSDSLIAPTKRYERGDYQAGLAQADAVVEAEYTTQTLNHTPLETHQVLCEWRGDTLDAYVSTQYIWGVRRELARKLGIPEDRVRVICEFMGGGFGAKNGIGEYIVLAAELARRTRRPVRCVLARREESVVGGNRNATRQRVTVAGRSDGTLTALGGEFVCAIGWKGWLPPTSGPMQLLYACENVRTVEHGAKLNLPPMAAFRAPGFVEGTWSLECALDKLAAELGVDPLELRRRNHAEVDTMNGRPFSAK
jgi:CO/xanthine dehydrogenase Mo-binding subunit